MISIPTYRNVHDGAISYGDPQHWDFPDDWERVFVFTREELYAGIMADREASARAIEAAEADVDGEDTAFYNGLGYAADIVRDPNRV